MNIDGYLVIRKGIKWNGDSCIFKKRKPALQQNEIAVKVNIDIPNSFFTQPQLQFNIVVPADAAPKKEISAEIRGNIQDIIQENLGIRVHLLTDTEHGD